MEMKTITCFISIILIIGCIPSINGVDIETTTNLESTDMNGYQNQKQIEEYDSSLSDSEDLTAIITQVTQSLVYGYTASLVGFGPRVTGTTACYASGDYIESTFNGMGLEVLSQDWGNGDNIEGTLPGMDTSSDEIYLVCGHYDSVTGSPGADDNAGGVAAVMAAAKVLSQYSFAHTIKFVAFSGEEQGLHGSQYYASQAANNGDNIVHVLNADMIGYADTQSGRDNVHMKGSGSIAFMAQQISDSYPGLMDLNIIPGSASANSDHWPFMQEGYDAGMFHEYEFNPYYHSSQDTMDKMDFNYLMRVSRVICGCLAEYADFIPPSKGGKGFLPLLVDIEYPSMNEVVEGEITLRGTSFHPDGNSNLKFVAVQIDTSDWDMAEGTINWTYELDTSTLPDGEHLISVLSSDGVRQSGVEYLSIIIDNNNYPPLSPSISSGINTGVTGETYSFTVSTEDPDNDQIKYGFDWDGDNGIDEWTDFFPSGEEVTVNHLWEYGDIGLHQIKVKAEDTFEKQSGFSDALPVQIDKSDFESPRLTIEKPENFIYRNNEEVIAFFLPVILGDIDIIIQASDDLSGIDVINVYVNGQKVKTFHEQPSPYSFMWEEAQLGMYTLSIEAMDKEGNENQMEMKVFNIN